MRDSTDLKTGLAERVRDALDRHDDVPKEIIAVSARGGVVTLTGNVTAQRIREVAEDVASSVAGVRKVRNLVMVDVDRWIEDEALCRNIKHALSEIPALAEQDVRVAVVGDAAVLSGQVNRELLKRAAVAVVERFRVRSIRNDILVEAAHA